VRLRPNNVEMKKTRAGSCAGLAGMVMPGGAGGSRIGQSKAPRPGSDRPGCTRWRQETALCGKSHAFLGAASFSATLLCCLVSAWNPARKSERLFRFRSTCRPGFTPRVAGCSALTSSLPAPASLFQNHAGQLKWCTCCAKDDWRRHSSDVSNYLIIIWDLTQEEAIVRGESGCGKFYISQGATVCIILQQPDST